MKLIDINKIYHNKLEDVQVFENLNAVFPRSGFILISGDSGMGKSTLFNIIAGIDKDYQGKVECDEKVEYLNQQIILYENLSVNENLILVDDNQALIDEMLEKFELMDLKEHKVKKLSNGEKRRVQIIRSLMTQPDILLCDEPSSSLDYDNALLVLELLRTVSETTTVLVTTHDQELFLPYIDSLYEIKDKKLICTKKHEDPLVIHKETQEVSRNFFRYLQVCLMNMKAHLSTNVITVFLLICMIISTYSCFYYTNKSNEELAKQKWYYSSNLVNAVPKIKKTFLDDAGRDMYQRYDFFQHQNLEDSLKMNQNIIGYTWQFDHYQYLNYDQNGYLIDYTQIFKHRQTHLVDDIYYTEFKWPLATFLPVKEIYDVVDPVGLETVATDFVETYAFPYQMIDIKYLPLIKGHYPSLDNEAVIGKDMAEHLCHYLGYEKIEGVVGKTLTLQPGYNSIVGLDAFYNTDLKIKIVGITSLENAFERRLYFNDGAFQRLVADTCEFSLDNMQYNVVKYLVDPMKKNEDVCDTLNQTIPLEHDTFEVFTNEESVFAKNMQVIQINSSMVIIASVILILISFVGLIVNKLYFKKQFMKENMILKQYHYKNMKVECLSNIMIAVFATVVSMAVIPLLIMLLNILSQMIAHYDLLTVNLFHLIICGIVVNLLYFTVMIMITMVVLNNG